MNILLVDQNYDWLVDTVQYLSEWKEVNSLGATLPEKCLEILGRQRIHYLIINSKFIHPQGTIPLNEVRSRLKDLRIIIMRDSPAGGTPAEWMELPQILKPSSPKDLEISIKGWIKDCPLDDKTWHPVNLSNMGTTIPKPAPTIYPPFKASLPPTAKAPAPKLNDLQRPKPASLPIAKPPQWPPPA